MEKHHSFVCLLSARQVFITQWQRQQGQRSRYNQRRIDRAVKQCKVSQAPIKQGSKKTTLTGCSCGCHHCRDHMLADSWAATSRALRTSHTWCCSCTCRSCTSPRRCCSCYTNSKTAGSHRAGCTEYRQCSCSGSNPRRQAGNKSDTCV